jgi:small basic protein
MGVWALLNTLWGVILLALYGTFSAQVISAGVFFWVMVALIVANTAVVVPKNRTLYFPV